MRPTRRTALTLALSLLLSSCAMTPPVTPPGDVDQLTRARALVTQGCYRCLLEARDLYEDLLRRDVAPATATGGLFQTALLVGLRERELGLPGKGSVERAADLAGAATAPAEWRTYVEIAESLGWQSVGLTKEFLDEVAAVRRETFDLREGWNAALQPLVSTDPIAAYLYLGLNCSGRWFSDQPPELLEVLAAHDDALFVRYRQAQCGGGLVELSAIQTLDPRFTEMEFFLGQRAMLDRDRGLAEFHFQETHRDWPDWPAPALGLGDLAFAAEDFEGSVPYYDAALALVTDQRDALLGKAKALSYLGQSKEALPPLDRLLELGQWYLGDVYFWRAWNRFNLNVVEPARADIEEAKNYRTDSEVFKLSGVIALDQGRLAYARLELETAINRNADDCDASFHLGRVHIAETRWPDTGRAFGTATQCYSDAEAQRVADLEQLRRDPAMPEDRRARLVARRETELVTVRRQAAASAYNAALGHFNARTPAEARRFAEEASSHPDFAERATSLLSLIDGLP